MQFQSFNLVDTLINQKNIRLISLFPCLYLGHVQKADAHCQSLIFSSHFHLFLHRTQQIGREFIDVQNITEDYLQILKQYQVNINYVNRW